MAKTKKSEIANRFLVPSIGWHGQGSTSPHIPHFPGFSLPEKASSVFSARKKFSSKCFLPLGEFERSMREIGRRLNAK